MYIVSVVEVVGFEPTSTMLKTSDNKPLYYTSVFIHLSVFRDREAVTNSSTTDLILRTQSESNRLQILLHGVTIRCNSHYALCPFVENIRFERPSRDPNSRCNLATLYSRFSPRCEIRTHGPSHPVTITSFQGWQLQPNSLNRGYQPRVGGSNSNLIIDSDICNHYTTPSKLKILINLATNEDFYIEFLIRLYKHIVSHIVFRILIDYNLRLLWLYFYVYIIFHFIIVYISFQNRFFDFFLQKYDFFFILQNFS